MKHLRNLFTEIVTMKKHSVIHFTHKAALSSLIYGEKYTWMQ